MNIKELEKKCNTEVWNKFWYYAQKEYNDTPQEFCNYYEDSLVFLEENLLPIKEITFDSEKRMFSLLDDFIIDANVTRKKKNLFLRIL